MSIPISPSGSQSAVPILPFPDFPNENLKLQSWLQMVQVHSASGSAEDISNLQALAKAIPGYDPNQAPCEITEVIEKVKSLAQEKQYNPSLSPTSEKALINFAKTATTKPNCAKKLNFD